MLEIVLSMIDFSTGLIAFLLEDKQKFMCGEVDKDIFLLIFDCAKHVKLFIYAIESKRKWYLVMFIVIL